MMKENPLVSLELFAEVPSATLDALWKAGRVRSLHKKYILTNAPIVCASLPKIM